MCEVRNPKKGVGEKIKPNVTYYIVYTPEIF